MAQTFWTDAAGQRREYSPETLRLSGLHGQARRVLERNRIWDQENPGADHDDVGITEGGRVVKSGGFSPWMLAPLAPLAAFAFPAAAAAGGAAPSVGGVTSALPGAIASQGVSAGLSGAAGAGGMGFFGSLGKWLTNPLVSQGIESGMNYLGQRSQAGAARDAAEAQERMAREALDFEKGVYEDDKRFFEPYGAAGNESIARISDLARRPIDPVTAEGLMQSGRTSQPNLGAVRRPRLSDMVRY